MREAIKIDKKNKMAIAILAALLLLAGICAYIIWHGGSENKIAEIYQNGKCIKTIDLNQIKESYQFRVEGENGAYNEIKVEKNGISVVEANCPDHICIQFGVLQDGLIPIVCLPNHLVIQMHGENKEGMDTKSY